MDDWRQSPAPQFPDVAINEAGGTDWRANAGIMAGTAQLSRGVCKVPLRPPCCPLKPRRCRPYCYFELSASLLSLYLAS